MQLIFKGSLISKGIINLVPCSKTKRLKNYGQLEHATKSEEVEDSDLVNFCEDGTNLLRLSHL